MEVAVKWWAMLLAALSTMAVGSTWYAPPIFGNIWMKLIGKTEKDLEKMACGRCYCYGLKYWFVAARLRRVE